MYKESETIEFKKSTAEFKEAVVAIVAMLNKHGQGEVYFRISDNGKVVGQDIGRMTIKEVTQVVVDNIEPKIYPKVEIRKIKGKDCVVIEAHGINSPYFAYGRAYIRVGESNKHLSVQEIENLIVKKKKLGLLHREKLTKAAEILFCDDSSMEIQAAVFAGTDKITFLDIRKFKGNIFNLREQAEAYVKEHIKWRAEIKTGPRKEIPEIPVEAIREAVGNSLCHRDYANPKGNEVAIFKDRVDIYNPGTFPDELNPQDFVKGGGYSILRNPLIAETMYKSEDIEKWASGLKRIYDECTAVGIKVEFKRVKTGFVVSFYRPRWEEGEGLEVGGQKTVEKTVERILVLIKDNPQITQKKLMVKTGLTRRGVEWNLKKLKEANRIRRIGPDKGGHWEV